LNIITAIKPDAMPDTGGFPGESSWAKAPPVSFCSDWCAANPDPERRTEVQMLWTPDRIFLRFHCRFRDIFTYDGGNTHRDRLWMRDVAEIFLRPGMWENTHYLEFEISPNGDWLDLDISPGRKSILNCDLKSSVTLDAGHKTWTAAIAIPVKCFHTPISPGDEWRLNLFRIEGREPKRFYSAWIPTHTPIPNFHVPDLFGVVRFQA